MGAEPHMMGQDRPDDWPQERSDDWPDYVSQGWTEVGGWSDVVPPRRRALR